MHVYGHNIVLSLFHPSLGELQYCFQWDIYWYLTLFKNLRKQGPPCLSPHPPHKPAGRACSSGWLAVVTGCCTTPQAASNVKCKQPPLDFFQSLALCHTNALWEQKCQWERPS
jgi:hypothetical protein